MDVEVLGERAILGLPSQSAHPCSINTGAPGCLAGNIVLLAIHLVSGYGAPWWDHHILEKAN